MKNFVIDMIIHSDQGSHYKSNIYKSILKKSGVRQSMSKEELIKSIDDYIYWYNNCRFQAGLKNMTPAEYRCHMIS